MSSAIENACTPFFQVHILHGNDAKDDDDDDDVDDGGVGVGDGDGDGDFLTICSTLMSSRLSIRKQRFRETDEAFHYLR